MKLFNLTISEGYQYVQSTEDGGSGSILQAIRRNPKSGSWEPLPVEIVDENEGGRSRKSADIMLLGPISSLVVVRRHGSTEVRRLLLDFGELLPLSNPNAELDLYNPRIIDALDEEGSDVWRFTNGAIMSIRRYSFIKERVSDVHVFSIPNLLVSPVFFSEYAVGLIEQSGLALGISFNEIWAQ